MYLLSLQGKSHEEISLQMNITINTVKKHKNNANHYMRERLKYLLSILTWI
ncbi:MAG: sigma factor-like helix-turn-helix DNA-binding protein [Butyricimonas virosa]|nr:sigma factor-like helix-turn-helix DNA-binding protein [Butyricimonas virosa]